MPDMKFRLTSDGQKTHVTHAVTGETIPCTRIEFRHWVGEPPVLNLEILCELIEVDITSGGEVNPPTPPSPKAIEDGNVTAIEDAQAMAYDRAWGRR